MICPPYRDGDHLGCPEDDDLSGLVSLDPLPPVAYDGPIHDADGPGAA